MIKLKKIVIELEKIALGLGKIVLGLVKIALGLGKIGIEIIIDILIARLTLGFLMAIFIVFAVLDWSEKSTQMEIEKEAILQLESSFILNEVNILQNSFSEYISIVANSVSLGRSPTKQNKRENKRALLSLKTKMESRLEIISIYSGDIKTKPDSCDIKTKSDSYDIKTKSKSFIKDIVSLNKMLSSKRLSSKMLGSSDILKLNNQREKVKKCYGSLLAEVKIAAIKVAIKAWEHHQEKKTNPESRVLQYSLEAWQDFLKEWSDSLEALTSDTP